MAQRQAITTAAQAEKADERKLQQQARALADWKMVLGTAAGRRIVYRWIMDGRIFETVFNGSAEVHYRDGQRSLGLAAYLWVQAVDPMLWPQMQAEAAEDPLA